MEGLKWKEEAETDESLAKYEDKRSKGREDKK